MSTLNRFPASLSIAGLALALAALAPLTANAGTEQRTVAEFDAIALGGSFNLDVSQGTTASVTVSADDKLLPLIETVVDNGRLEVRWKRGTQTWGWKHGDVKVTVVTPKLRGLSTAGSGDIQLQAFNTPALKLSIAGSGNAVLSALTTDDLGVTVAGSGDVKGAGKATKVAISIAGSGDVKLMEMKSDDATVKISGSGSATINAIKTLAVSIAGSGDVVYSGEASVKSSVAGSGSVTKK
jgi:Putative auto-transporter adhesin, head GIN domain